MAYFYTPKSLTARLAEEAKLLREKVELLAPGAVRDATVRAARQANTAAHVEDWINSPGLKPPK